MGKELNKKSLVFGFLFVLVVIGFLGSVSAVPEIEDWQGIVSDGENLTISGRGFGVKDNAEPILWNDFDSGIQGDHLEEHSDWVSYAYDGATYSSTMPYGDNGLCAYNYHEYANAETHGFATNYFLFPESEEIYYSYMSRYDGTGGQERVYKNGRINSGSNRYNGNGSVAISDNYVLYNPGGSSIYPDGRRFREVELDSNNWQRHQIYGKLSDPPGTANGIILAQVKTEKKLYENVITRREGYSYQYTSVLLGLMMANLESGDYHHMYVDDVYVDNTLARVELCNGTNWSKNIKCEIQTPQSWSEDSITFDFNQGSFQEGETAYLYVVNENGSVNEEGYPITIGEGSSSNSSYPKCSEGKITETCTCGGNAYWAGYCCNGHWFDFSYEKDTGGCPQGDFYYVSNNSVSTDWQAAQNIETPTTPETAMQNAQAGDVVFFRGGRYDVGQSRYPWTVLYPENSGTSDSLIIFRAYPNEIPIINGNINTKVEGIADVGTNNSQIVDNDVDFLSNNVEGWDIARTPDKEGGAALERGSVFEHKVILQDIEGPHNNIDIQEGDRYTIGEDGTNVLGNGYQDYIVFDGFRIQANNGKERGAIVIKGNSEDDQTIGNIVKNCFIDGPSRKIVHGDNREGLRIDEALNIKVHNCKIQDFVHINGNSHNTGAIKMYHDDNFTFTNLEIANSTSGIYIKNDNHEGLIKDSFIYENYIGILDTFKCPGECLHSDNITVYNNLLVDNSYQSISFYGQETAHADNTNVNSNTIYCSSELDNAHGASLSEGHDMKFYNNIIEGCTARKLGFAYDDYSVSDCDYNHFGSSDFSISTHMYHGTQYYYNLDEWQNSGELKNGENPGSGSLIGNPKFINYSGIMSEIKDFELAEDSPCKGAGRNGGDIGADVSNIGYNPLSYYLANASSGPENQTQTYHPADTNPQNGIVSFIEVENYMNRWLNGEITINQLLDGINEWRGF